MIVVLKKWMDRLFGNEEAILLVVLLVATFSLILFWGGMLAPVLIAVVLSFLLQGGVQRLSSLGMPNWISVTTVFLLFCGAVALILVYLLPLVWRQTVNLFNETPRMISQLKRSALELQSKYPEWLTEDAILASTELATNHLTNFGEWVITNSFSNLIGVASLLVYAVLVPFLVFFMLKDQRVLLVWFQRFLPERRPFMELLYSEMNIQVANYIRGKVIEIFIIGVSTYVVFLVIGVNYAELLALLVGLSVLIPFIGAAVVTIPILVVGYIQWGLGTEFYSLAIAYTIIQALDGNVLVPLLFSETVNLHPVAIIVAVLFFGGIWGFWGVFFAIPLATLVKALIYSWPVGYKQEGVEG